MTGSPIPWKWLLAAVVAAGLLAIAVQALRQNRPLLAEVRAHDSLSLRTWLDTLRVWAPLGLVVLGLWLGVRAVRDLGQSWLFRYTALDEFCTVEGTPGPIVLPCTDREGTLPASALRRAGVPVDVSQHLFEKYTAARARQLATPVAELRVQARDSAAFASSFSPASVLGLPERRPLDPLLLSLFERRQAILADPVRRLQATIGTVVPQLNIGSSNQELAAINGQIQRRLQQLREQEFGHLSPLERARGYARNRIVIGMRDIQVPVDAAVLEALSDGDSNGDGNAASMPAPLPFERLAAPAAEDARASDPDDRLRRGIARTFADSEAAAYGVLSRRITSPFEAQAAYGLLGMRPLCTLASDGESDAGDDIVPCFHEGDARESWPLASLGFRESLRRSIDRWRTQARFDTHVRLAELDREAAATALDARQAAERTTALVPATIPLGRQDCRLWKPHNCVINQFAEAVEAGLARARNQAVAATNARAARGVDRSSLGVKAQIDATRLDAGTRIDALHASARENLERWFDWMDLLALLGYLLLGLIVAKSLLYVLALELFHKDSKLAISFDTPNTAEGSFVHGPMVVIDKHFPRALITKKQMGNTNSALQFVAWPRVAPLLRMFRRRYFFFNRGTFIASGEAGQAAGMVATAESPLSVVLWQMVPGEEVVFDYKNFHGASENVTLHKELSLRLSTLLLGRWNFHYARCGEGEGILLLKARVQAVDQAFVTAIPRPRLVAWNRHMRFKADSQRHPWRSLVNDFTIVRSQDPGRPPGKWLTAPEQTELGTFGRLVAFLKSVFSAMF